MSAATPPIRQARRIPVGLLGMLVLVSVVETTISARRLDFTTVWADDWRCAAGAASHHVKGRDVLCFGDSLVKIGVYPKVIEARTGLKSYNLAVNAGTVPATYFLLRQALNAGAKPKAIVVDFFALMLPDDSLKATRRFSELATPGDCLELAMLEGAPEFLSATLLGKLLPSYKCRFEVRNSIKAALEGRRASPWPDQAGIWENWKSQDGAQPMPGNPNRLLATPMLLSDLAPVGWTCDPINATYVEKFLALAGSRNIPVFWLMPPVSPEIQVYRDLRRTDEAYDRFARATLERHPDVTVLDARHSGYDGSVFIDPIHLDKRGAKALTSDLASRLVDRLGGRNQAEHWVALPTFGGRSEGVARAGEILKSSR
jgi:hypothetical protein